MVFRSDSPPVASAPVSRHGATASFAPGVPRSGPPRSVGTVALATTALNAIPGAADEIVMATAYTATGILGHLAPLSE